MEILGFEAPTSRAVSARFRGNVTTLRNSVAQAHAGLTRFRGNAANRGSSASRGTSAYGGTCAFRGASAINGTSTIQARIPLGACHCTGER